MTNPPPRVRRLLGPTVAAVGLYVAMLVACFLHYGAIAPEALDRHVGDDTYYFLQIANHVASGEGSCFSPGEPTNGYHPLWLAILSVLRWLLPVSRDTMALLAPALSALAMALAAMPLQQFLLRTGTEPRRALVATLVCMLNPWVACFAINGLETGLFLLLLFAVCAHAALPASARPASARKDALVFGLVAGLLMLARTDAIFFTVPIFCWLAFGRKRSWPWILLAGGVAVLLLSPWLLWCLWTFGTIEQSSSSAIALILQAGRHDLGVWWAIVEETFSRMVRNVGVFPLVHATSYNSERIYQFAAVFLGLVALFLLHRLVRRRQHLRLPVWFWGPALALAVFYIAVRHFLQVWHLSTVVVLCALYVGGFLASFGATVRRVGIAVLVLASMWATRNGYFTPQDGGIGRIREFAAGSHEPMRIGNTDAGRFSYFRNDVVVNLDGIVNNAALRHIRAGRLCDYMVRQQFDLVMMSADRYDFYNRNVVTVPSTRLPPAAAGQDPVAGCIDVVERKAGADGAAVVRLEGWVGTSRCDAASTYPLLAFLDEHQVPLAAFRGVRFERKDVMQVMKYAKLNFSGCRFTVRPDQVPGNARFVRLGVELADEALWMAAPLPVSF